MVNLSIRPEGLHGMEAAGAGWCRGPPGGLRSLLPVRRQAGQGSGVSGDQCDQSALSTALPGYPAAKTPHKVPEQRRRAVSPRRAPFSQQGPTTGREIGA